jgi:hypothetical protein
LIGRLATRLWVIEDGALRDFSGTLEEYDVATAAPPPEPQPRRRLREVAASASNRRLEQSRQEMEEAIHEREASLKDLGEQINAASAAGNLRRLTELGGQFEALQREVEQLMAEWAGLQ